MLTLPPPLFFPIQQPVLFIFCLSRLFFGPVYFLLIPYLICRTNCSSPLCATLTTKKDREIIYLTMLARLCHRTRLACVQTLRIGAKLRWMSSSSTKNKDPFPRKWDSEVDPVPASAQKEIHRLKAMEGVRVAGN